MSDGEIIDRLKMLLPADPPKPDGSPTPPDPQNTCSICGGVFSNLAGLCSHQLVSGHAETKQTPNGPTFLCWKKGCNQYFKSIQAMQVHFREIHARADSEKLNNNLDFCTSERHTYKYRCGQCSLAFRTEEKLKYHQQYHLMRRATKCQICTRNFRTVESLRKHMDASHPELTFIPANGAFSTKSSPGLSNNQFDSNGLGSPSGSATPEEGAGSPDSQFDEETMRQVANTEGSYADPSKKFRCHRCKVAYARQSYLTAHNKTLLHRRGEKLGFNVDKFNDPARPFKCEICKESFTQKNMLIGHNNSVLHLNRCKKLGVTSPEKEGEKSMPKDEKPYKCNICKVQQSQSTTLDIHLRSVYHQNRVARYHELVASGEVDPSKPWVEIPNQEPKNNGNSTSEAAKNKEFLEFLGQMEANSNAMAQQQSAAFMSFLPFMNQGFLPGFPPVLGGGVTCPTCRMPFPSKEILDLHQKSCSGQDFASLLDTSFGRNVQDKVPTRGTFQKLLQTYGFEVVMQYNEMHKRKRPKALPPISSLAEKESLDEEKENLEDPPPEKRSKSDEEPCTSTQENEKPEKSEPPELSRCECSECGRQFSSIFVLKAHVEEIHRNLVPTEIVEQVSEKIKEMLEKIETEGPSEDLRVSKSEKEGVGSGTPKPKQEPPATPKPGDTPQTPTSSSGLTAQQLDALNAMNMGLQFMGLPFNPFGSPFQPPFMQMLMPPFDPLTFAAMNAMPGAFGAATCNTPAPTPKSEPMETSTVPTTSAARQNSQTLNAALMAAQAAQAQYAANQNKRARTRITDDQLKILREYFDINNSPSETQIKEMSLKAALPEKVIKHWFRNTLFKERQKNKDSPYNFNVPPSMGIDLEQYEKTGEAKIIPYKPDMEGIKSEKAQDPEMKPDLPEPKKPEIPIPKPEISTAEQNAIASLQASLAFNTLNAQEALRHLTTMPPVQTVGGFPGFNPLAMMSPAKPVFGQNSSISPQSSSGGSNNGDLSSLFQSAISPASMGQPGRRANRTRFTDEQVRTLQEFFEQNAYPKDDDLEHLSKRLYLSPRVIVVWFQNARQKARKLYENQTGDQTSDPNSDRIRTPGNNFKCRRCEASFPRPHDLRRHQQAVCYKNEVDFEGGTSDGLHCDACNLDFSDQNQFDEHRKVHMTNPGLFARNPAENSGSDSCPGSPGPTGKRQRTQILPEQLDLLFEIYSREANPSSKLLDEIAGQVGLQKRVVQVWFQNTRARDRKGQLSNAGHAIFNKRCPCCGILFHSKSTMENHLATRHSDQSRRLEVNIDSLPDAEEVPNFSGFPGAQTPGGGGQNPPRPDFLTGLIPTSDSLQKLVEMQTKIPQSVPEAARDGISDWLAKMAGKDTKNDEESSQIDDDEYYIDDDSRSSLQGPSPGPGMSPGTSTPFLGQRSMFGPHQKRHRTHMSPVQIKVMKELFKDYKTPTMPECELLGQELGLGKRVVQVWFQNARAKERKAKVGIFGLFCCFLVFFGFVMEYFRIHRSIFC